MGMNYYCKTGRKASVTCDCGFEHLLDEELHVGKDSYGWAFHLQGYRPGEDYHNSVLADKTTKIVSLDDWKKILQSASKIYDEDGKELTYDEMLDIILKKEIINDDYWNEDINREVERINSNPFSFFPSYRVENRNNLLCDSECLLNANPAPDENYMLDYADFT